MEPSDEWANIGYWGDHQIIYLLRLLEASARFNPGRLGARLDDETHVYAEIPYRIRSYEEILKDPRNTVDYDDAWEKRIEERVERIGADGKLMPNAQGDTADGQPS
jgi:predicted transcriptional regulator